MFKSRPSHFNLKKRVPIKDDGVYERLVNWVIGEFDLYLKNESENLKVYFPNGCFSVTCFKYDGELGFIEIKVKGKSRIACNKMMNKLESIYNHVLCLMKLN